MTTPQIKTGFTMYLGSQKDGDASLTAGTKRFTLEAGGMGQNYLRSLFALGFQGFLIIVCVAIYAVLVRNIATIDDISAAIWTCMGYTVLLFFTLFKTGSLSKSIFAAH